MQAIIICLRYIYVIFIIILYHIIFAHQRSINIKFAPLSNRAPGLIISSDRRQHISSFHLFTGYAWQGRRMAKRFTRGGEKSRSESGRVAGTRSLSPVRTMGYRRLYRRGAARRSVTRRRDGNTRLSRAFCRVSPHTHT